MGAGKNKSHRKKRISKHVLEAEERRKQADVERRLLSATENERGNAPPPSSNVTKDTRASNEAAGPKEKESISPSSKTKDPEKASAYLIAWNYDRENNTKRWKFNKNTQSWLLRHMYDANKLSKATFALLVEYMCHGGEGAKLRVEEDAKRRARQYKNWMKEQNPGEGKQVGEGVGDEMGQENAQSTKKKEKELLLVADELWNKLDDHQKRNQYKRARKVLDALKAVREENKTS